MIFDLKLIDLNVLSNIIFDCKNVDYFIVLNGYIMGNDFDVYKFLYLSDVLYNYLNYYNKDLDVFWEKGVVIVDDKEC